MFLAAGSLVWALTRILPNSPLLMTFRLVFAYPPHPEFGFNTHVRDVCQLLRKAAQPLSFSRSF